MPNTKTMVKYRGTREQEDELKRVVAEYHGEPGALMPVLQKAQDIFGYLPEQVQIMIAEGLNVPLTEVYGVVSFYTQFSLNPKGNTIVTVCMGTACYVKGAQEILNKVVERLDCQPGAITPDGNFSVDATRCIGACGLAPVMFVNDDVYGRLTPQEVSQILDKYMT